MSLPRILDGWANRNIIRAAAVVSEDGLLVHDLLRPNSDGEAIAALAMTVVQHGRQLADADGSPEVRAVVLDLPQGAAILAPVDPDHTLVVFAEPDCDIGPLLFEIRESRAVLSQSI